MTSVIIPHTKDKVEYFSYSIGFMNISDKQLDNFDVIIVGGGMVGATQAQALLKQNKRVLLVEQNLPSHDWLKSVPLRVSAINLFSEDYLKELGVWSHIDRGHKCMFDQLGTWDNPKQKLIFSAEEIGKVHLGHLIRNEALQLAAYDAFADSLDNGSLMLTDASVLNIENDIEQVVVTLDKSGEKWQIVAGLVIAADGANSKVRQMAGMGITGWDYQQHCFSITIKTEFPTQSITWQEFQPSGPKAFLPLENGFACLIWYDHPEIVKKLKKLINQVSIHKSSP